MLATSTIREEHAIALENWPQQLGNLIFRLRTTLDRFRLGQWVVVRVRSWGVSLRRLRRINWRRFQNPRELRRVIAANSGGISILALLVTIGAGAYLIVGMLSGPRAPKTRAAWFYDVGSGAYFVLPATPIPPVAAPSGMKLDDGSPAGVRARVFSCGDCADRAHWIVYLERYTPKAQQTLHQMTAAPGPPGPPGPSGGPGLANLTSPAALQDVGQGHLIARPDLKDGWTPLGTQDIERYLAENLPPCTTSRPHECLP